MTLNRVQLYFHRLSLTIYALLAEGRYILSVLNTAADSANGVWFNFGIIIAMTYEIYSKCSSCICWLTILLDISSQSFW